MPGGRSGFNIGEQEPGRHLSPTPASYAIFNRLYVHIDKRICSRSSCPNLNTSNSKGFVMIKFIRRRGWVVAAAVVLVALGRLARTTNGWDIWPF